ncbi:winged helix-turn-helix domain-containing protein [Halorientalis litorea]|uniref:winged helix-turn-helix domain-containing protein n=1 Tax=Halorientalis litorea TaxID=2931977 RepID=UPI001FF5A03D|nr:winged helix-turn-helix domain-containing protein [Halorientalis litorea]
MAGTRTPADWMVPLDERILEILRGEGWSSPSYIARKVSLFCSVGRVRERCQFLTYAELVEPLSPERDNYDITGRGIQYLEGRLNAGNLPRPSGREVL